MASLIVTWACLTGRGTTRPLTMAQKIEDFEYLFQQFRANHPYLALKARVEGFDWIGMKDEFEEMVKRGQNNEDFAKAIDWMVALVNNAHTRVAGGQTVAAWRKVERSISSYLWRHASSRIANYWFRLAKGDPVYTGHVPFHAVYFGGNYVVTEIKKGYDLGFSPGFLVTAVNGEDVHSFVASLRGTDYFPYDPVSGRVFQQNLRFPEANDWLVTLKAPGEDGEEIQTKVPYLKGDWNPQSDWFPPRYRYMGGDDFARSKVLGYTTFFDDERVAYAHIKSMGPTDREDMKRLLKFFQSAKNSRAIILDVRGNRGGAKGFWTTMVSYLIPEPVTYSYSVALRQGEQVSRFAGGFLTRDKDAFLSSLTPVERACLPREILTEDFLTPVTITETIRPNEQSVNYEGQVFLLVDHRTYSAGDWLSLFCKSTGWAYLVGTPTGGDGLGLTSAIPVVLPNSGIVVLFPSGMGLNPDWSANEENHTMPDCLVDLSGSSGDWVTEPGGVFRNLDLAYDPVLAKCLQVISDVP